MRTAAFSNNIKQYVAPRQLEVRVSIDQDVQIHPNLVTYVVQGLHNRLDRAMRNPCRTVFNCYLIEGPDLQSAITLINQFLDQGHRLVEKVPRVT